MNTFVAMPLERRRILCEQAGARTGLFEASVEKDFWVCWTLEKLFALPRWGEALTFKGGTSLSKCWKLIERFSEDIDIVIDRDALGFAGDKAPSQASSNKQTKKRLDALGEAARSCVHESIRPQLMADMTAQLPAEPGWSLEPDPHDPQGQTLLFAYPTAFPDRLGYLRPVVKIEMGARSDTDPASTVDIRPIVAEVFPQVIVNGTLAVRSVQPVRTFWEKAMLLHEESCRPADKTRRKQGMARHYYDLYRLIESGIAEQAMQDRKLFQRIAEHRRVYFRYTWMDYATLAPGTLRIVPRDDQRAHWQSDYAGMQAEMFYGEVPEFDAVLASVRKFQDAFNGQDA
jgi:hypothetical protein